MDQLKKMRDYRDAQTGLSQPRSSSAVGKKPVFWGIFSGKGGVGKSILSAALALQLARMGYKTLLVDTDFSLPCAQLLFNLDNFAEPEELLRNDLRAETFDSGIENLHVFVMQPQIEPHSAGVLRSFEAFIQNTTAGFDFIILDGANGFAEIHRRLIPSLSLMTIISTADPASIAGAYALIKMAKMVQEKLPLNIAFNRMESPEHAKDAFVKINLIVKHFLHFQIPMLCWLRDDKQISEFIHESVSPDQWPVHLAILKTMAATLQKLAPALQPMEQNPANRAKAFA